MGDPRVIKCPRFFKLMYQALPVLLSLYPGYTGRIVITIHCENGEPKCCATDMPDRPRSFKELTTEA
jgi:hypothetical protein